MKRLCFIVCCLSVITLDAQADLRHMQYNLTLFGNPFACNETTNNTSDKEGWLSQIVDYSQPDVLCVNEMADSDFYADRLLNNALNVGGMTQWSRAELTDFATTSSIVNAFYYRSDKFELHEQVYINQALDGSYLLRPTDFYTIYPIPVVGDTTFITFAVVHLAASDENERADQTEATMAEIQERGFENVIFSGDLNIDSSSEEAFQNLLFPSDESYAMRDPVDALGTWHNNGFYSDYHTQSTRFNDTNSGCFSPGGLDDRFDMTLVTDAILNGTNGVTYLMDSYRVLGQGGNSYNSELPTTNNGDVPDEVALALYEMSDHLPVLTDFVVEGIVSLTEDEKRPFQLVNPMQDILRIQTAALTKGALRLFDLSGRVVLAHQGSFEAPQNVTHLIPGLYLLRLDTEDGRTFVEKVVKR